MPGRRELQNTAKRRVEEALFEKSFKVLRVFSGSHLIHRHIHARAETVDVVPKCAPSPPSRTPLQAPQEEPQKSDLNELPDEVTSHSAKAAKQTRTRQTIDEFLAVSDQLADELMEHYANSRMGTLCSCGSSTRTVTCHDCFAYTPLCRNCFMKDHRTNPFHWAQEWNPEKQFFQRRDISALEDEHSAYIQLGHSAHETCRIPSNEQSFLVTHLNGVHATKVRFCECQGLPNRRSQLMKARLLPATLNETKGAFTFAMLKVHHVLSLQGKISAFDYIHSLRRLTDNAFTSLVPDPYPAFVRVQRIWEMLILKKRLGQMHSIDKHFPHRPQGNLTLFCPCCPEPGVNLQRGWNETPLELRHLTSTNFTLDGNHKVPRYTKNTDPSDRSLYAGKAYFPEHEFYMKYIVDASPNGEKSTCNYLKVVNSQDRKKFRSMDETGMVNCQCDHVFIMSSVDMLFKYADLALAMALRARPFETEDILEKVFSKYSYDIVCKWLINILTDKRFACFFPDVIHRLKEAGWIVPALHIQNHKDDCMYMYSSSYMESAAHFHGETSEYTWPSSNQIGPQVSQMNKGHRQDKIIDHHSDWNWKKMANQASLLANELVRAWKLFTEKRSHFQRLTRLRMDHVPTWGTMDKTPRKENGEVLSPYRHMGVKVPTLEAISKHLQESSNEWVSAGISSGRSVPFLTEAFSIQRDQVRLKQDIEQHKEHPLSSLQTSITTLSKQLSLRIEKWRLAQAITMPSVHKYVANAPPSTIQDETLFLPSDFTSAERAELGLEALAAQEVTLREADGYDDITHLQTAVKSVSAMRNRKAKNTTGQTQLTRALAKITNAEVWQALWEARHAHTRKKLVKLGAIHEDDKNSRFPPLTQDDLYRNPTEVKRAKGATYHRDGRLWTTGRVGDIEPSLLSTVQPAVSPSPPSLPTTFTKQSQRKSGPRKQPQSPPKTSSDRLGNQGSDSHVKKNPTPSSAKGTSTPSEEARPSGWIWRLGKGGLSDEEFIAWEMEEDRVQWFRAWAEMSRWLEQFEVKHVEFIRCIKSFESTSSAWNSMAEYALTLNPGYAAYARRQSATFADLAAIAKQTFEDKGYAEFVHLGNEERIADKMLSFRKAELKWLEDAILGTVTD